MAKSWRVRGSSPPADVLRSIPRASGLRSPSSTRSIIDPSSSPNIGSGPSSPGVLDRMGEAGTMQLEGTRYAREDVVAVASNAHTRTRLALSRPRAKPHVKKASRQCSPHLRSRQLKRRAVGCLLSGGLLATILTICKFHPCVSKTDLKTGRSGSDNVSFCRWRLLSRDLDNAHTSCYNCLFPLPHKTVYGGLSTKTI